MPQTHKSVAFSGKKKKEQLRARKERKLFIPTGNVPEHQRIDHHGGSELSETQFAELKQDGSTEPVYNLKFRKETPEEAERRKAHHYIEIDQVPEYKLEATSDHFYPPGLGYPTRPPWRKNTSKQELDHSENKHFRLFCEKLDRDFAAVDLSLYELNLETWRQLWRVTEMSDILLIIVDARFSVAQFPPYLYKHLVEKDNKGIILILNKCDLLPPAVIAAWEQYFHNKFPKLIVVPFSSVEGYAFRKGTLRMAAEGSLRLIDACQKLVDDSVNLDLWRKKVEEERELESEAGHECEATEGVTVMAQSTRPELHQRFQNGILTLGTIGNPNVGKSSLINAIMGKKVVSVSKTPGHTKHFQTIFLTKNVKLCDCPGLVFPSTVCTPLQVVQGSYPISQVRDPVGVVQYIASRLNIPGLLKLFSDEVEGSKWTSYYICEAWARKRGYFTRARGGPDVSRGANELLRMCLNGQKSLVLFFRPPGYCKDRGKWNKFEANPRVEEIKLIQGIHAKDTEPQPREKAMDEGIEEDEPGEEMEGRENHEDTEENETESEEEEPRATIQNKFAILIEDD
ncbi:Guanine nucleotide-binding protein-like 1-like, partial [Homarus americanus]